MTWRIQTPAAGSRGTVHRMPQARASETQRERSTEKKEGPGCGPRRGATGATLHPTLRSCRGLAGPGAGPVPREGPPPEAGWEYTLGDGWRGAWATWAPREQYPAGGSLRVDSRLAQVGAVASVLHARGRPPLPPSSRGPSVRGRGGGRSRRGAQTASNPETLATLKGCHRDKQSLRLRGPTPAPCSHPSQQTQL